LHLDIDRTRLLVILCFDSSFSVMFWIKSLLKFCNLNSSLPRSEFQDWMKPLSAAFFTFSHSFLTTNYAKYMCRMMKIVVKGEITWIRQMEPRLLSVLCIWIFIFILTLDTLPIFHFTFVLWKAHKFSCRYFFLWP
jgi:hypothetical protein